MSSLREQARSPDGKLRSYRLAQVTAAVLLDAASSDDEKDEARAELRSLLHAEHRGRPLYRVQIAAARAILSDPVYTSAFDS